jgi:hypothetical protein
MQVLTDRKGLRRFGDVAGVDELGPDARFFADADCWGIRLVAVSRGELAHNVQRPTLTTTLSIANRHSGLRAHLLDPRPIARQMPVQGRGRTHIRPDSPPRSATCRPRQHGARCPDLGIIQRRRTTTTATTSGCRDQTGAGAFNDDLPLHLTQCAEVLSRNRPNGQDSTTTRGAVDHPRQDRTRPKAVLHRVGGIGRAASANRPFAGTA